MDDDTAPLSAAALADPASRPEAAALLAAFREVLGPVAQLAIAKGLVCAEVQDVLRLCFVDAARQMHPQVARARVATRISATTGLHRREVNRLLDTPDAPLTPGRSPATETFLRWRTDPAWQGPDGQPLDLPHHGPAPSFDALAESVTLDLSPRSLLEELSRLGLARLDTGTGHVCLLREAFVPGDDERRLLGLVAANTRDHLQAAVANLLQRRAPPHLERAVFADELSPESVQQLQPLYEAQWQSLTRAMAPALQALIDEDHRAGRPQTERVRIGLYTFHAPMPAAAPTGAPSKKDLAP